jgi:hypothetical protein
VPHREWHQKYGLIIRYYFPFGAERLSVADDDAHKANDHQKSLQLSQARQREALEG